jgi:NTP pyrophosphatase (non-canonical NTP hydrolase)
MQQCHGANVKAGWWSSLGSNPNDSNKPQKYKLHRNVGELLMLCVSELAEAMEGDRKNLQDDKLPQYKMIDVELADALIRICDLAGARGAPLGEILAAKMQYNAQRADHKPENRALPGGKKY